MCKKYTIFVTFTRSRIRTQNTKEEQIIYNKTPQKHQTLQARFLKGGGVKRRPEHAQLLQLEPVIYIGNT